MLGQPFWITCIFSYYGHVIYILRHICNLVVEYEHYCYNASLDAGFRLRDTNVL